MSHPPEKGESREHGAHDPLPYCVHMSLHVSCVSSVVHAGTFHARLQLDCIPRPGDATRRAVPSRGGSSRMSRVLIKEKGGVCPLK